jgi:hypothetical protein
VLRVSELVPALLLAQAVGERPFGHFDHDANAVAGPPSNGSRPAARAAGTAVFGNLEEYEDPVTGEALYRPR